MKRLMLILILATLLSQLVIAADLSVKVLEKDSTVLVESDKTATFLLEITNNELIDDRFEIYSLVGVSIYPIEPFNIAAGSTKQLEIEVVPHKETKRDIKGIYAFEYQIKGKQTKFFIDRLSIKIAELKEAISVEAQNIRPEDEEAKITVKNLEEFDFENLTIKAESFFYDFSETFNLGRNEQKTFTVPMQKDRIKKLSAGIYDLSITLEYNGYKAEKQTELKYLEQGDILEKTNSNGLIIRERTITKSNEGNIETSVEITERKDVLSRLFTTFSERPHSSQRDGLFVNYAWEKLVLPGESSSIKITTNYTIPFVILVAIILVVVIARVVLNKTLIIQKRVSLMKTKGGEFALKVTLKAKARRHLGHVRITDTLPRLTKLYEKFGTKPDKIDENARKMLWNLKDMKAGEERIITYIIYSKVKIIGTFELPAAHASFELDGKPKDLYSNRTSLAAETIEDN